MGDVLSQSEIDNLLAAISSGEVDADSMGNETEKQAKEYDFARPSKISKEHLRALENIYEHYGRLLSTHLPIYLRKNVQVEIVSVEATTYSEFSNSLVNPILLAIINMSPLNGNGLISLGANLGYAIIDRMLGGAGETLEKTRDFSDIELVILEKIFNIFTGLLIEPWENVLKLEPTMERIETNSQFSQLYSPNEMSAIIILNITVMDISGMMSICLPYNLLEPIIDKLNTKYWYSVEQVDVEGDFKERIEESISKAIIPIKAILGKSVISVNEFVNLQRGDIVKLGKRTNEELEVFVGNMQKFTAIPGASQDSYAIKIKTIVREEEK